ncbi:MAG: hypothetical protein P4M00_20965 [Azospirillaceae bacterium]|nr:hypothetical protein [Azospirillaceae bacterium]
MSDNYVDSKVRDALRAAQGNRGRAQRLLVGLLEQDSRLLRGLAQPFLKAIVAAAIERVTRGTGVATTPGLGAPSPTGPVAPPRTGGRGPRTLAPEQLDRVLAQLGQGPDPAAGSGGKQAPVNSPSVDPASVRRLGPDQASTMVALAAAFKRKRGE